MHPNFVSLCVQPGNFENLLCEDCRLATPQVFFRGFGPCYQEPHFHVRMLFY